MRKINLKINYTLQYIYCEMSFILAWREVRIMDFILTSILWILALYGLTEIIKTIIHVHKYPKISFDGTSFILTVKNQENNIEYFLRLFIYKILYYNLSIPKMIIVDLDSTDNTLGILRKFAEDFYFINVLTFDEYKSLLTEQKEVL